MNKIKKMTRKGFTLVELVVVIAIIAILGAVSVVGYLGFVDNAKQSAAEQEAQQYETVILAGAADKNSGFRLTGDTLTVDNNSLLDLPADDEVYATLATKKTNDAFLQKVLFYCFKMTETKTLDESVAFVESGTATADATINGIIYTAANGKTATIDFK